MATKVITQLVDDIDGTEAAETVRFGLDGQQYEIELSEANAAGMRSTLEEFVSAARRSRTAAPLPAPKSGKAGASSQRAEVRAEVRAWAMANGIGVSPVGRIPKSVLEQYTAAH